VNGCPGRRNRSNSQPPANRAGEAAIFRKFGRQIRRTGNTVGNIVGNTVEDSVEDSEGPIAAISRGQAPYNNTLIFVEFVAASLLTMRRKACASLRNQKLL
jgi:hypothetical protein